MLSALRIFVFGCMLTTVHPETYDDVLNLRTTLMTSYDPDILPLDDQSGSLNINLTMVIFKMAVVDPIQGAITMGIMVTQEWYDERLTWAPADHNGTMSIFIKSENIWTPPLTVANPVTFTLLDTSWMQTMLMYNGMVSYTVGGIIQFSCSFNMKFWPFDKQTCSLSLFPYGYPESKVTFAVPGTVVDTGIYTPNGEWFLDEDSFEYEINSIFGMSRIMYKFKIARLPSFYVLTIIMPINGIGALMCLVFLLPVESGERVCYSITIMLSLAVFLTVTAEDLPKDGSPIPIISLYILFNLIVCIAGLVCVTLNLRLYYRTDKTPMSRFYKSIVRFTKIKWCRRKPQEVTPDKDYSASKYSSMKRRNTILVTNKEDAEKTQEEPIEWVDVADAFDKLLFYIFVIATYVPSIIMLIYTSAASDYSTLT